MEFAAMLLRPALLSLLTAFPAFAEDAFSLPEGYPPKMGDVTGQLGEEPKHWETYDFSIGAFDGSAWVGAGHKEPKTTVIIMAFAPGQPQELAGRLHAFAEFGDALRLGEGEAVHVAILKGEDLDGPRLTSEGDSARLIIDSIGPTRDDSYNRRVTGRIEARLCPYDWAGQICRDLSLAFDTDMQMEPRVLVRD